MPNHNYSCCWTHFIWGTRNRERMLPRSVRPSVSRYLFQYAASKEIRMPANYVNADHVHVLIDLPVRYSPARVVKLLKGSSSHWINRQDLIRARFSWGRGYGAFSVSPSKLEATKLYITRQEKHHRRRSFAAEYQAFLQGYGVKALGNR